MIIPSELRIGNLYQDEQGHWYVVREIEYDSRVDSYFSNGTATNSMLPILLSEKILLKCGFEKTNFNTHTDIYRKHPLEIIYNVANGFEYNINAKFARAISLHQLQNLYFALTGTEIFKHPLNVV